GVPLLAMQCQSVVLNEQRCRDQIQLAHQRGNGGRLYHGTRFTVQDDFHRSISAASQSFHTGSIPLRRKTAAISRGDRESLISNWAAAMPSSRLAGGTTSGGTIRPRTVRWTFSLPWPV